MALFRRSQIHTVNDPTFGPIQFERGLWASLPNESHDGWSVIIDAPPSGPSSEQRALFHRLKDQVERIREKAVAFVEQHMGVQKTIGGLQVYAIEVGKDEDCCAARFVIELTDAQGDTIHRVRFDRGEPQEYSCDD